ncbi:MAG: type IV pilus twitching motility protein PilT [Candidatus Omnitrophica bacterium]|nr:type IV pilus twitching motility protein PilT [Candidatus Omnitrophota bacterium]
MAQDINSLLNAIIEKNASDIHLHVDKPPTMRLNDRLIDLDEKPLTPDDTLTYMKAITPPEGQQEVEKVGGTDFGYAFEDKARFRVSVYRQKGNINIAMRLIPYKFLSFEELGLSQSIKKLCHRPRGLVLVTGPTGSGKTTTLATMIDYINSSRDCHIITIEDPIEYYHTHKKSIVTQRELGADVPSFPEALRRGLRQDPDVFLVGEMRDLDTISAAITAAETGHLIFGTLHTTGAARTVDRIVDVFPIDQQEQIRIMLSVSIIAVVSEQLLVRADGKGRIAAFEIMVATPAIQNLIREKKTYRILSELQTGAKYGMKTMDESLIELYSSGLITYENLLGNAYDPEQIRIQVEGVKKR